VIKLLDVHKLFPTLKSYVKECGNPGAMDLPHTYSKYWSLDISKYDVFHTVELPHKNFEMVLPRDSRKEHFLAFLKETFVVA
jgi:hypothetical protein